MDRPERITSAVRITIDDAIVRVVGIGESHSPESVHEMGDTVLDMTGGRRLPILFDTRDWGPIEPTSWAAFIQRIEDLCPAAAVLANIEGTGAGYVGVYPTIIDSLVIPFRVFDQEAAALEFLAPYAKR